MGWTLFKGSSGDLVTQADAAIAAFKAENTDASRQKDNKMRRQVEIWSLKEASPGLEQEYKNVASEVAYLVKKILCLDQHIKDLQLAKFHFQNGSANRLKELLNIADPCANITSDIPLIDFKKSAAP
jgi:hypothetical protein